MADHRKIEEKDFFRLEFLLYFSRLKIVRGAYILRNTRKETF